MFKLALDAGHSMNTAGKRCLKSLDPNETREWFLNNRLCNHIQRELQGYDIQILRLDDTTGVVDIPLIERTNKANAWGSDLTISVHHNAGANGTAAGGITTHIYTYAKEPIITYQKNLYGTLIRVTGLKGNRASPLVKNNLHMTREINGYKSILVEHGYMDSSTDVPIILTDEFSRKAAKAHAEFLITTFGLKKGESMNVGDKVIIKNSATTYMTGQTISSAYKGKEYTIQALGTSSNGRLGGALIQELVSWVWLKDLELTKPPVPVCPDCTKLQTEVNSLKVQMTTITNERNNLRANLTLAEANIVTLKNSESSLKTQITNLNEKIKQNIAEINAYKGQIQELNDTIIALRGQNTTMANDLNTLKDEFSSLETTCVEIGIENDSLQEIVLNITDSLNEKIMQLDLVTSNYQALELQLKNLEEHAQLIEKDFESLTIGGILDVLFEKILDKIKQKFSTK